MRRVLCWLGSVVFGLSALATTARGEPVVGIDVGAAIPVETFSDTANPGGALAPYAGYRLFTLADSVALSLIAQPQFAFFGTGVTSHPQSDVTSIFSFGGGPRLSLLDGPVEIFFAATAGYYFDVTGPVNDDDGGFSIASGLNYEFARGDALGLYLRRDQSSMQAARGSSDDLTFLTSGFSYQHRFLPPEPVAEAAPPPPPPPPPPPVKEKIVLRGVHFDFDKANIRDDAKPILNEAARTLQEHGSIAVAVEGHTDSRGTDAYNDKLSLRRATAVRDYLEGRGIAASRMTVEGFGESRPVASNDTEDGRAQNRRVELRIINE